ncbi:MAG: asparagine synthase [Asgard group archaeon]|nr:asparagine synthase [Asgard group archaeon]
MTGINLPSLVSIFHFGGALIGKQLVFDKEVPKVKSTFDFPFAGFESIPYKKNDSYIRLYNSTKKMLEGHKGKKIGMPLSGGIDSSVMLYIVQEINKKENFDLKITAYNQIFDFRDESKFAQAVADKTNTELKIINQTTEDNLKIMDEMFRLSPDPIMGNAHIYNLSKIMKKDGNETTINSLGGDECWGGYPPHRLVHENIFSKHIYTRQNIKSKVLRGILSPISPRMYWYHINTRFNPRIDFLNPKIYSKATKRIAKEITNLIFNARYIWNYYDYLSPTNNLPKKGLLSLWNANEYFTFYKCDKLYKHQIFSLGKIAGLEVLFPYLEEDYVKYALALDKSVKIKDGISKWGMREMMKDKLPKENLMRGAYGDKFGWGETYETLWEKGYKGFIEDMLNYEKVREYSFLNWDWINNTMKRLAQRHRGAEARVLISMALFQKILELYK